MDDNQQKEQRPRRPYRKPELRQVPLRPEEAVLGNCKNLNQAGLGNSNCHAGGSWCNAQGS